MGKINSDTINNNEQYSYLKERVRNLEVELELAIRAKADANYEAKRIQANLDLIER